MLTLADGQVAVTTAAEILSGGSAGAQCVRGTFVNTNAATQTLILTFARAGGTARQIVRATLAQYEQLRISGLPMDAGDSLLAVTTTASAVDYVLGGSEGDADGPLVVQTVDSAGSVKQVASAVTGDQSISGDFTVGDDLVLGGAITDTPGASTAAAGSTTSDAGVLPAATSAIYPTTAADDTKGVRVHADDKITGRMIFIGNGVSNKILKVYAPSGGTINGAAGDAAFSSVSGKGVIIVCLSSGSNTWLAW